MEFKTKRDQVYERMHVYGKLASCDTTQPRFSDREFVTELFKLLGIAEDKKSIVKRTPSNQEVEEMRKGMDSFQKDILKDD